MRKLETYIKFSKRHFLQGHYHNEPCVCFAKQITFAQKKKKKTTKEKQNKHKNSKAHPYRHVQPSKSGDENFGPPLL